MRCCKRVKDEFYKFRLTVGLKRHTFLGTDSRQPQIEECGGDKNGKEIFPKETAANIGVTSLLKKFKGLSNSCPNETYLTKCFNRSRHLFLANFFILLLLRRRLQSLPWQCPSIEIHENIPQRLHVIPSAVQTKCQLINQKVPRRK